MEDLLSGMVEEKRIRIINSAMKEFARNTYEKASTNNIVKDANISKGLLFHYFKNKEGLYNYLRQFTINTMRDGLKDGVNWENTDIFLRIKDILYMKYKMMMIYPYIVEFSLKIFNNKSLDELVEIVPDFSMDDYLDIYTMNIDYSLFKEDMNIEKSINIIRWTIDKYTEEIRKKNIKPEEFLPEEFEREFYEYLDILKKCFYK